MRDQIRTFAIVLALSALMLNIAYSASGGSHYQAQTPEKSRTADAMTPFTFDEKGFVGVVGEVLRAADDNFGAIKGKRDARDTSLLRWYTAVNLPGAIQCRLAGHDADPDLSYVCEITRTTDKDSLMDLYGKLVEALRNSVLKGYALEVPHVQRIYSFFAGVNFDRGYDYPSLFLHAWALAGETYTLSLYVNVSAKWNYEHEYLRTSTRKADNADTVTTAPSTRRTESSVPQTDGKDAESAIDRIRRGQHSPMPQAERAPAGVSGSGGVTLENGTNYTIRVYFGGPASRTITIAPRSSTKVDLGVGLYRDAAEVLRSTILPFYGYHYQERNADYHVKFYVTQ